MGAFDRQIDAAAEGEKLRQALGTIIGLRFGHGEDIPAGPVYMKDFGPCVAAAKEYEFKSESDIRAFEKRLGDLADKNDIMTDLRRDWDRSFTERLLLRFNPDDFFTETSFLDRIRSFHEKGDFSGAKAAADHWLDMDSGPLAADRKRRAMNDEPVSCSLKIAMRARGDGVFVDMRAGRGDWRTVDGTVGEPENFQDAMKMAKKLGGKSKAGKAPKM